MSFSKKNAPSLTLSQNYHTVNYPVTLLTSLVCNGALWQSNNITGNVFIMGRRSYEKQESRCQTEFEGKIPYTYVIYTRKRWRVIVALDQQKICGYGTVSKTDCIPDICYPPYIGYLFVDEEYRGNRSIQKLIQYAIDYLKSIGFDRVHLISDHDNFIPISYTTP